MAYHFRNLVFEGGGVKGIAYVGAMEVMKKAGALDNIQRVGGTSAGAINALFVALGYTIAEQRKILASTDFKKFMDDSFGVVRDIDRLLDEYGWNKGDYFHEWISEKIAKKLGDGNATFQDLKDAGRPDLYVYGTNLSTGYGEVYSVERTPTERIADALRITMSIPLFFASVRNPRGDVYVDGGVLNNYPVKLFDRRKYLSDDLIDTGRVTEYYESENKRFLSDGHTGSNPKEYIYNRETLGFRLDSAQEIAAFRYGRVERKHEIEDFFDYVKALLSALMGVQENSHLHSDDWARTVYIDTLGVSTTDFDLKKTTKDKLVESGRKSAKEYLKWFKKAGKSPDEESGRPPNALPKEI